MMVIKFILFNLVAAASIFSYPTSSLRGNRARASEEGKMAHDRSYITSEPKSGGAKVWGFFNATESVNEVDGNEEMKPTREDMVTKEPEEAAWTIDAMVVIEFLILLFTFSSFFDVKIKKSAILRF